MDIYRDAIWHIWYWTHVFFDTYNSGSDILKINIKLLITHSGHGSVS